MPLPNLKPLFQAAGQAYQEITKKTNLADLVAELKTEGGTTEEQNKHLLDKLAAMKELQDDYIKALHTILTYCGKLVTPTENRSTQQLWFELQDSDANLYTEHVLLQSQLRSHSHPFCDAYELFKWGVKKHVGELEARDAAQAKQLAQAKMLQPILDEAKREKERLIAEHQAQLQALMKAHQAALDEARRENERLTAELQALNKRYQTTESELTAALKNLADLQSTQSHKQPQSDPGEAKRGNTDKGFAGTPFSLCAPVNPARPGTRAADSELAADKSKGPAKTLSATQV